jgi:hypothetical protein
VTPVIKPDAAIGSVSCVRSRREAFTDVMPTSRTTKAAETTILTRVSMGDLSKESGGAEATLTDLAVTLY